MPLETDRSGHRLKIGLFGGTLDPIHVGHLRAAEEVYERLGLHQVWFLPAPMPPHKLSAGCTSFEKRLKMVELATEGLGHLRASNLEQFRTGISYSVDLLRFFRKSRDLKHMAPFFIVGADAFLEMDTWKEFEEIPRLSNLVVITRPPFQKPDIIEKASTLFPGYQITVLENENKKVTGDLDKKLLIVPVTPLGISSTGIRKLAGENKSVRFLVTRKVQEYIMANGLYVLDKTGKVAGNPSQGSYSPASQGIEPAREIYRAILDNKGEEIVVLDMRGTSPMADFFIIAQGRSTRHVQGMASRMRRELSRKQIKCKSIEGQEEGKWILMDFDDVVVHLFYEPVRSFYDLEGLWAEAPRMIMMGGALVREEENE